MGFKQFLVGATSLLGAVSAQHVIFTSGGHGLAVNVPADTASSGNGPIYMQISAPSGTQWVGVGQGSRMAGANMFVVYSRDSTNVTVSPRSGKGEFMPLFDSSAQITVLEGSGIAGDGSMVANIRCDSCLGGTMSATSSSSNWIMAYKQGDALDTDDTSATISQHDSDTGFTLDLTQGTGGSSSNPFVQQSSSPEASGTASSNPTATGTATGTTQTAATGTNGVSTPIASNSSNDGSASRVVSDPNDAIRSSHGIIMSILFVGCFPLFSLTLYLPWAIKVRFIHAPLQMLSLVLLIVGMALGIVLGNKISQLDGYHMVIGFIVVAGMVLAQPAMGVYQHMYYHKTGGKSAFGIAHRWLGRTLIALGIVNGGIGFMISGETSAYTPYAIVAAIVFLIYLLVLGFAWFKSRKNMSVDNEKAPSNRSNYEMQPPRQAPHSRLPSDDHKNAYQQQNKMNATYTINART